MEVDLQEVVRLHGMYLRGEAGGVMASLAGADLRKADLRCADLRGADLRYASLCNADLRYANLRYASLCNADLSGANLRNANLVGVDLRGADLFDADLRGAKLNGAKDGAVARLDFGGWSVCVRSTQTTIGCQSHANESWLSWSPDSPEIAAMHKDATEWWRVHGESVKSVIRCVMDKAASENLQKVGVSDVE